MYPSIWSLASPLFKAISEYVYTHTHTHKYGKTAFGRRDDSQNGTTSLLKSWMNKTLSYQSLTVSKVSITLLKFLFVSMTLNFYEFFLELCVGEWLSLLYYSIFSLTKGLDLERIKTFLRAIKLLHDRIL